MAGHLAAAQCRFLILIGDYDARGAWAAWDLPSCAAWLAWRCQIAPGTAREHVRTARALRQLPLVRKEFAAGRMSYAKARALTRIAAAGTEAGLIELTRSMTAGQAERFARAHRQATEAQASAGQPAAARRKLSWRWDEDTGELSISVHLPAADGAVVLQALRAATGDLDHSRDAPGKDRAGVPAETSHAVAPDVSAETRPEPLKVAAENLAAALTEVAAAYLAGKIAAADNADIYQVLIHTTPHALTTPVPDAGVPGQPGVPAGTPAGHPAAPGRCHLEDGPAITPRAAQLAACTATLSVMLHDAAGEVLNVGRRRRTATARIRKAVRERDRYRCTFPGCGSRRTDLQPHHLLVQRRPDQHAEHAAAVPDPPHPGTRPRLHHHPRHPRMGLHHTRHRHHPPARLAAARHGPRHRRPAPGRHHPRHHHPAAQRRTTRPQPRHLDRPQQRPHPRRRIKRQRMLYLVTGRWTTVRLLGRSPV